MYFRTCQPVSHAWAVPGGRVRTLFVGGVVNGFLVLVVGAVMGLVAGCGGKEKVEEAAPGQVSSGQRYVSPWDKPIAGAEAAKAPTPKLTEAASDGGAWSSLLEAAGISAAGVGLPGGMGAAAEDPARGQGLERIAPVPLDVPVVAASRNEWSIVIASFEKQRGGAQAAAMLRQVQRVPGLAGAYLEERGKALVIGFGRYNDAGSARRELDKIREMVVEGDRPFRAAALAPPVFEAIAGSIPDHDLRNVKTIFGKDALYTLQVGVYGKSGGADATQKEMAEFRAAAERAVVDLRREGEEAFYYHGPRRSMVTVGVFTAQEYDANDSSRESPRLTVLREKYPYNLENGAGIRRKRPGQAEARIDPSFIVMIPGG